MELRHLRYFTMVAETRNITRAAARLHVAQPALSRQLTDLENDIGVSLLERGRHGVTLTPAGREFHRRAKQLLADARRAGDAARDAAGAVAGRLTLGFFSALQLDHLSPVIQGFRKDFPRVQLDYRCDSHANQLQGVRDGSIDIAFIDLSEPPPGCERLVVWRIPFMVVMPAKHRLARKKVILLDDLKGEDFVFCTRASRPAFYDAFFTHCGNAGFHPQVVQEVGGYPSTMLGLVALGVGLSLLPRFERAENIRGLVWKPLDRPHLWIDISLVWMKDSPPPALLAFIDRARAMLPVTGPERGAVTGL
mgnify:CR=1 FL=1